MPRAGSAAMPSGVVPHVVAHSHDLPSADRGPVPVAPMLSAGRDASAFLAHIKEVGKPGLVSFVGNAFGARSEDGVLTLFFDKTRANLIPMIRNAGHLNTLRELAEQFFGASLEIQFAVGNDPQLVAKEAGEREAMRVVNDHPTIKFLLERFKGKITSCQVIEAAKE